ncbi:TraB/GumN family protein [Fretibacter rubidus]|uniref:TraB/GumN family protein n=1 Tax=Fretibacter rubidus TaxID=570162 RepID=UPI00352B1620
MKHSFFTHVLLLISAGLMACTQGGTVGGKVSDARARNDGPAIWVVRDFDSTLFLYGTVHLLSPDIDWMRDDMREAFAEAGTVFFEVDTETNAQIKASVLTQSLGFYSDGRRLRDRLDGYQLKLLEAASNNGNVPLATLDNMKPWLASEFLTIAAAANVGLTPELSADDALKSRAARQQKNVLYLDSIEAQITRAAQMPELVQMTVLSETLEGFNTIEGDLTRITTAWTTGNVNFLTDEVINAVKAKSPEVYQSLYVDVNKDWAAQLTRFMEGSGTGFAAIGVGHLLGDDSLQEQLIERGYEVKRYLAFMGDPVIETIDTTLVKNPDADE